MSAFEFLSSRMPVRDLTREPSLTSAFTASAPTEIFDRIAAILFRSQRRHVLISGDRGVGKTATATQFASRVASGAFRFLRGHRCLWLDAQHLGPEDSRSCLETIAAMVAEIGPTLLCLDGIQALLRRSQGSTNSAFLRSILQSPQFRVIGILPRTEYGELFAGDVDLLRQFDHLELLEPDEERACEIVALSARQFEQQAGLEISAELARRAVQLTSNYVLNESLPDKAIRVIQEALDRVRFLRDEQGVSRQSVEVSDLLTVLANKTGIPEETLAGTTADADWEGALSAKVVGQSTAIAAVAEELRLIKSGLTPPQKPASVMLFAGMTGVGKTELARRLAEVYAATRRLQNYSMANFSEPHSVSGIVGVPPGYVGHDQGGRLINDLNGDPSAVFLLDEAEKAHPNVWKPFLTLFDEGWIVDQRGMKAQADRAIFILTTNVGSDEIAQMTRAGKSAEEIAERVVHLLSRYRQEKSAQPVFPPAFLARIRRVVVFQSLSSETMQKIAREQVNSRIRQWQQRWDQALRIDDDIVEWIGRCAYHRNEAVNGREGGRIVQKLVSTTIDAALARAKAQQIGHGTQVLLVSAAELPDPAGSSTIGVSLIVTAN